MKNTISILLAIFMLFTLTYGITASAKTTSTEKPEAITDESYMFPSFKNGEVLLNKRQGRLPAMGWNSWNAFGSGNTEELTKTMADALVDLGLADLGYEYIVLDDGCYKSTRVDGKLSNDTVKFPSGFKALSDYVHGKGLKFGMYNDIGTRLCAGSWVGTVGHEDLDAQTYLDWGVDFLKVDNCYYLWDNATFSDGTNAKYTYAPNIRSVTVSGNGYKKTLNAVSDGKLLGTGGQKNSSGNYVTNLGTLDGTNTGQTPVGDLWSELEFDFDDIPSDGEYSVTVNYATAQRAGAGEWLQAAVGSAENEKRFYDDFLPATPSETSFKDSEPMSVTLGAGKNIIRVMNHRRQENTLQSYAALLDSFNNADKDHDLYLSICEWGKTQPQNWGYKVGNSWRILNDISFAVGNTNGSAGSASWDAGGTASVVSQYSKAVIMDEFAGLDKGWNDPDMLVIGMDGITTTMSKTHMSMWCMMNSPLMLGIDLRRVKVGDEIWNIIANKDMIALNQDALGVQAKRIYTSAANSAPDTTYVENTNRVDILAKPLSDGGVAVSFMNIGSGAVGAQSVDVNRITEYIGKKMTNADAFKNAGKYYVKDLWSKDVSINETGTFSVDGLDAYDSVTVKILPLSGAGDMKVILNEQIESCEKTLASKDPADKTLLKNAGAAFGAAIDEAKRLCASASASIEDLEKEVGTLARMRDEFEAAYREYDEFKALVEKAESAAENPDRYVHDGAWSDFLAALEKARGIYNDPQTADELKASSEELTAARKAVKRNMSDGLGPAAWYIFDEPGADTAEDVSGNGNDARLVNTGAVMTPDGTLSLNANNENDGYMEIPANVLKNAESFTFASWVKLGEYRTWARLFDFGVSSSEGYMFLSPSNGSDKLSYAATLTGNGAEQSVSGSRPAVGDWVHIAVVQDGNTVTLYTNGNKSASGTVNLHPSQILRDTAHCYIGKSQWPDPYLKAEIKDMRIYDKALTQEDISKIVSQYSSGITAADKANVTARYGRELSLPESVSVTLENGAKSTAAVTWDEYDKSKLSEGKPFTVYGTLAGTDVKARADITFTSMSVNDDFHADVSVNDADGARYARVMIANLSDTEKSVNIYPAAYNEDGSLKSVGAYSEKLAPGGYKTIDAPAFTDTDTRVFVWSDMEPVTEPQDITPYGTVSWTVVRPDKNSVTVNSGNSMTILTQSGDLWDKKDGAGTAKNIYLTDISEADRDSFTVEVTAKLRPSQNYQRAALIIYAGDGNQVSVMRRYHSAYGGSVFMTTMNTNGAAGAEDKYTNDIYSDECRLRLKKDGDKFYGYFSVDDGKTWEELETRQQSVLSSSPDIKAGFYASNGDENASSVPVTFEDFMLNGKAVSFWDAE